MKTKLLSAGLLIFGLSNVVGQTTYLGTGSSTVPQSNTNIGTYAGCTNADAGATFYNRFNVSIGFEAGRSFTSSSTYVPSLNSVFIGYQAGKEGGGQNSVFVGSGAGFRSTGASNAFVGAGAGNMNVGGLENAFFGTGAGYSNTSGSYNTIIGSRSTGGNSNGTANVLVGMESGWCSTAAGSGQFNTFLGARSGKNVLTGTYNVGIGHGAGSGNANGSDNISIGNGTGAGSAGGDNIFLGRNTGNASIGGNNIFIGINATKSVTGAGNMVLGSTNIAAGTNGAVVIASGNSSVHKMYINAAGNVGIGTGMNVSPLNRLDIEGNLAVGANYAANFTAPANGMIVQGRLGIGNTNPNTNLEITQGTTGNSGLRFTNLLNTYVPSSTASTFLTVDGSGNVVLCNLPGSSSGLTTVAGGAGISVTGTASSGYTIAAAPVLSLNPTTNVLSITGGSNVTLPNSQNIYNHSDVLAGHRTVGLGGYNLFFDQTSGGKVYIGMPSADYSGTYGLYVEKGILTEKVKVAVKGSGSWADYVFADDYELKPLSEVESFIKKNKHLPDVPSSEELVKEGLDLADMQAKQMEKIEELTLYIIKQEKQMAAQLQELEALKSQVNALLQKK